MVFQNPLLVDWRTVLGNLLLQIDLRGLRRRDYVGRAHELRASAGLAEFADRHPYELSGGMQQRTSFCRALIHDPPLILMDEPLGALDAMTREQLRRPRAPLDAQEEDRDLRDPRHRGGRPALGPGDRDLAPARTIARALAIEIPRPRTLEVCETPQFHAHGAEIRRIFFSYGVI
jgi:NitT/TauT family transport system ATP-binding protein